MCQTPSFLGKLESETRFLREIGVGGIVSKKDFSQTQSFFDKLKSVTKFLRKLEEETKLPRQTCVGGKVS